MLASLFVVSLFSAARQPSAAPPAQALERPDWALEVPRVDKVHDLLTFFARAGTQTALLLPNTWLPELHPLFPVDFEDAAQLQRVGISPRAALVVSERPPNRLTCVTVDSLTAYTTRAEEELLAAGELWRQKAGSANVVGLKREGKVVAAFAAKGNRVCSVVSGRGKEAAWKEAVSALGKAPGTVGPARLWLPKGSGVMSGNEQGMKAFGELRTPAIPKMLKSQVNALPEHVPSGLVFVRGRVDPANLMEYFEPNLIALCSACPRSAIRALLAQVAQELNGELMWRVDGLVPNPDFSSQPARIRSLRYAAALGLQRPEGAPQRFAQALQAAGATGTGRDWQMPLDGRGVAIRFTDQAVWLYTDPRSLELLDHSPLGKGTSQDGTYVRLDAHLAAQALSRISIFDLLRQPELAPLVAASTELGPLLEMSDTLEWVIQPNSQYAFEWRFQL